MFVCAGDDAVVAGPSSVILLGQAAPHELESR